MEKIGIGADDAAFEFEEQLVEYLEEKDHEVEDYGVCSS